MRSRASSTFPVPLAALEPMLLKEARPPVRTDTERSYELKFDGYRLLAYVGAEGVFLKTRNGADATKWFGEIADALRAMQAGPYIFDGEVCVLDAIGRSDFDALQRRARARGWRAGLPTVVYCVFDVLMDRGHAIDGLPLSHRRGVLQRIVPSPRPALLRVQCVDDGEWLYARACALGLEGIVAKRFDSPYRGGLRTDDCLKIKRPGAIPPERFRRTTATR